MGIAMPPNPASAIPSIRILESVIAVDTMEAYGRMRPTRGAWFRIAIALWMLTELGWIQR